MKLRSIAAAILLSLALLSATACSSDSKSTAEEITEEDLAAALLEKGLRSGQARCAAKLMKDIGISEEGIQEAIDSDVETVAELDVSEEDQKKFAQALNKMLSDCTTA